MINIARGTIVDEEALVLALQEGRLGAFASDVFANEPHVPEALFGMSNVILIPHLGRVATAETRKAMGELMLRNLELFAKEPLENARSSIVELRLSRPLWKIVSSLLRRRRTREQYCELRVDPKL